VSVIRGIGTWQKKQVLSIVIFTEFFVRRLKMFFDIFGKSSPSAYHFQPQVVHWTGLWTVATYGFVFAESIVREGALAPVLTVSARKLYLQRQVLQRDISGFQEPLFAGWATWHCRSAGAADVVATQTEGDGRPHVLFAGRTLQLC
jgi:hypothetical protein